MSAKQFLYLIFFVAGLIFISSCNHNKIACPTYAGSLPEKKAKKSKKPSPGNESQPSMKVTKHKIGDVLPPGYKKAKKKQRTG